MSKYKLYEHFNGGKIITVDGISTYYTDTSNSYRKFTWRQYLEGDLAIDQGYKLIGVLTESEFFAELL